MAVTSPTRNSITTGMMKQKDGSTCSVSMIGVTIFSKRSLRDASEPDRNADQAGDEGRDAAEIDRRHGLFPEPGDGAEGGERRDEERPAATPPSR